MSVHSRRGQPYAGGLRSEVGALEPAELVARVHWYKRNVAKRYKALTSDRLDELEEGALHVSTKVDGELWFLSKLQGQVALVAPNGRVLEGAVPVCQEAERLLARCGDVLVAGELFVASADGRPRSGQVASTLADPTAAPKLGFKAFDLVNEAGADAWQTPYEQRFARLRELFGEGRRVAVVETVVIPRERVAERYVEWVESGRFEGLVARGESGRTYKVKPALTLDVVVLGFGEHRDSAVADVRELVVGLLRDDGRYQVLGTVANGLNDAQKITWLRRLEPMVVPSSFRMANSEGTLCRFVRPELVLEVRCTELLDTDTRDAPVRRMVLSHDPATGWVPEGLQPFAAMLHPVVVAERTDKPVHPDYVGLAQITANLPGDAEVAPAEVAAASAAAEQLDRKVWVKSGKGGTAVRKLVLVATHKGGGPDAEWPPFYAFFTDYSPGRKEPLQTSLKVASTRERLDAIAEAWIADNVKKGWEPR